MHTVKRAWDESKTFNYKQCFTAHYLTMLPFYIVSTAVLLIMHSYLFFKLRQILLPGIWQPCVIVFFVLMLAALLLRHQAFMSNLPSFVMWIVFIWLGFAAISTVLLLFSEVIRLAVYVMQLTAGITLPRIFSASFLTPLALVIASTMCGVGIYNAISPQAVYTTLETSKLPAGVDKFRIVAVSDAHLSSLIGPKLFGAITRFTDALAPDLFVILGDLVDDDMSNKKHEAGLLRNIQSRCGNYAVLGNHEVYNGLANSTNFIEKSGLTLLRNDSIEICGIQVTGLDDPMVKSALPASDQRPDFDFTSLPQDRFNLVLDHRPIIRTDAVGLFDLQLSGHTHGGQFWPFGILAKRANNIEQGLNEFTSSKGKSLIYVSDGAGFWGPPIRTRTRSEITVIDLVRPKVKES